MRNTILAAAFLILTSAVSAQNASLGKFCNKYKDCDMMTDLAGAAAFSSLFQAHDTSSRQSLMNKIKNMRLLTFDDPEKTPTAKEWTALVKNMRRDHFEELLSARKDGVGMSILSAEGADGIKELVFIGQGDDAFLLYVKGMFSDQDLSAMKVSMKDNGKNLL